MKTQTIFTSTLILLLANFLTKVIGALFKIPLANAISKEGMGLFSISYQIYTLIFILSTSGFPVAISKIISEKVAKNEKSNSRRIFLVSLITLATIGLVESFILFIFAKKIATIFGSPESYIGIMCIAPSLFFVSIASVYRGYFQGIRNMYPTAVSEVIESLSKLVLGLFLTKKILSFNINNNLSSPINFVTKEVISARNRMHFASFAALIGVTLGTIFASIFLKIMYIITKKNEKKTEKGCESNSSVKDILKQMVSIAIPITLMASISSLTNTIDFATVMNRLVVNPKVLDRYDYLFRKNHEFTNVHVDEVKKLEKRKANYLFGMYTGYAMPVFNLPLTVLVAISMSIVPAVSSELAKGNRKRAEKLARGVIKTTAVLALPAGIVMSLFSKPILSLIYNGDSDAYLILQKLSVSVIFVSLVSITASVLQSFNKFYCPVFNMIFGGVIKIILNYFLIPIYGIDAAPISTLVCYSVIAVLNFVSVIYSAKIKISLMEFVKVAVVSLFVSLLSLKIYNKLSLVLHRMIFNEFYINFASMVLSIILFLILYVPSLFLIRVFTRDEIKMLFSKNKISAALENEVSLR